MTQPLDDLGSPYISPSPCCVKVVLPPCGEGKLALPYGDSSFYPLASRHKEAKGPWRQLYAVVELNEPWWCLLLGPIPAILHSPELWRQEAQSPLSVIGREGKVEPLLLPTFHSQICVFFLPHRQDHKMISNLLHILHTCSRDMKCHPFRVFLRSWHCTCALGSCSSVLWS